MSGNPNLAWTCLTLGMLLQLSYMILPLQRWDWARYLGAAACALMWRIRFGNADPLDSLALCGVFTCAFAFIFQRRLLPILREGTILLWTTVLICVVIEALGWHSITTYICLLLASSVIVILIIPQALPYGLKVGVYG